MLIYPLWSSCLLPRSFQHISNKEYVHISSVELLVYFLESLNTYLIRNMLIYSLCSPWSTSLSFQHISDDHISSLELLVYYLKLLKHLEWGIYSYILFGAPSQLPCAFKTYWIRNMLLYPLWSSWSTSLSFQHISNKEYAHMSSLKLLVYFFQLFKHI